MELGIDPRNSTRLTIEELVLGTLLEGLGDVLLGKVDTLDAGWIQRFGHVESSSDFVDDVDLLGTPYQGKLDDAHLV